MNLVHGDCLEVMATFEPESIDAIVTDPPYDLTSGKRGGTGAASVNLDSPYGRARIGTGNGPGGFMGKAWDATGIAFRPETWAEALRIAKPGAHLLAFGGTRTYHRLACAIEDAGWEVRDCLVWAYASGFPKSLDVSKAIDKAAGAERPITGPNPNARESQRTAEGHVIWDGADLRSDRTAPATPEAAEWQGWGTALKPAWEPIIMARKPLRGTVAANVQRYGTGALNIDGTRIAAGDTEAIDLQPRPTDDANASWSKGEHTAFHYSRKGEASASRRYADEPGDFAALPGPRGGDARGRWPANVMLTDPIFDGDTPGVVGGGKQESTSIPGAWAPRGAFPIDNPSPTIYGDSGTYSRFFLLPKADRTDREPVLTRLDPRQDKAHRKSGVVDDPRLRGETWRQNFHPTVKPLALMRHLVRLVTPPGGIVLDPFLGSGTTALAAEMEGFEWIGIEKEAEYVAIAEARLNGTQRGIGL